MYKQIFLGNGNESAAECYELHRELERCFRILGGVQQPGATEDEIADAECEVELIALYIYERLTGNKITYA